MLLGGSIIGGLCHQLTDAGDTDIGIELNWPVAVNCAWPPCAVALAGLTVRDWSWRLLPHPDKVPIARINITKRRLHSLFMHASKTTDGPSYQAIGYYSMPSLRMLGNYESNLDELSTLPRRELGFAITPQ
jgi:hypothetical protein